jgi:Domain of unknown function (DUF6371)
MKKKRFIYEEYKTSKDRHTCPNCGKPKCFSREFDTETGEFVADHVGICNRKDKCGYNYTGWDFIKDNPDYNRGKNFTPKSTYIVPKIETETKLPTYIDKALFAPTLGFNKANILHRWLVNLFGQEIALYLIERFNIGTTSDGKAIMWRIDINGNILSSEIIEYVAKKSEETFTKTDCKRTSYINSVRCHHDFKESFTDFEKSHCCFGEQYLNDGKPIYLVESAKTVLIASVYLPQYTWIACEGAGNFSTSFLYLNSLKDRDIYLMPDLGKGFEEWSKRAELKEMKAFFKSVTVDDRLQNVVNVSEFEIKEGFDIGDFLIRSAPPQFEIPAISKMETTDNEPASTVEPTITDNVTVQNVGEGNLSPSDCEVVAIHDTPLTPFEIKAKLVIEWIMEHGKIFNGNSEMKSNIIKNIGLVENSMDDNEAMQALSILEGIKFSFGGK